MFTETGLQEGFKFDTKLITKLRKESIDDIIKGMKLKKSPKFSIIQNKGIDIDFHNSLFAQDFEDDFFEYLEDQDFDIAWTRKGSVIEIRTYDE